MFGDESEAAIVKVMRLREQLRPYVMEQFQAAAANGTPIMRPLFFDFHTDPNSQAVDDQLVCQELRLSSCVWWPMNHNESHLLSANAWNNSVPCRCLGRTISWHRCWSRV